MFQRLSWACALAILAALTGCGGNGKADGGIPAPACTPDCAGKQCGSDGCSGLCGTCPEGTACDPGSSTCLCDPQCGDRQCGPDACGGSCGACADDQQCSPSFTCQPRVCVPQCAGKGCGDDGCGGTCGSCPASTLCNYAGLCEVCTASCGSRVCGADPDGCSCGSCPAGKSCDATGACAACTPACDGKECGDDGCGGTCGACLAGQACAINGSCNWCVPGPECAGRTCGIDSHGCSCGACPAGQFCQRDGSCLACPDTMGSVTVDTLCPLLEHGLRKWTAWNYQMCGNAIDENDPAKLHMADVDHLDAEYFQLYPYASDLTEYGQPYSFPISVYDAQASCDGDLGAAYQALKAAVKAGHVCFDSQAVDACVGAGLAASVAGKFGQAAPDACSAFFTAHQQEGDPCDNQWECVSGLFCRAADGGKASCSGICRTPLTLGTACSDRDVCAKDTACQASASDPSAPHKCTALTAVGAGCDPQANGPQCVSEAYCDSNTNLCTARAGEGERCGMIDMNGDTNCLPGLSCSPAPAGSSVSGTTCQKNPTPGRTGDPCQSDSDCGSCLWCVSNSSGAGACTRMSKLGDSCDATHACGALLPLECDATSSQCVLPPREGQSCTVDKDNLADGTTVFQSQAGNCLYIDDYCQRTSAYATGLCSALPRVGEPCNDAFNRSPSCQGTAWCKGAVPPDSAGGNAVDGVCTALEADGAPCDSAADNPGAVCASGWCLRDAAGATTCGSPGKAGEPCATESTAPAPGICEPGSFCVAPAGDAGAQVPLCAALLAGGEACSDDSQCTSGHCGSDAVCALDCLNPPGTATDGCGSYSGFNWFARYIFVSGMLVFFARRRRRG